MSYFKSKVVTMHRQEHIIVEVNKITEREISGKFWK